VHDDGSVEHKAAFLRVDGRLLSAAWHASGGAVFAGSSDGLVHAFDVATRTELYRINVAERTKGSSELRVWALQGLADGTLVSGDSSGRVCFWDGEHGTRLHAFDQHEADVLALAATPDGSRVFAAGVDSSLVCFEQAGRAPGEPPRWTFSVARRPHTHDVRALLVAPFPEGVIGDDDSSSDDEDDDDEDNGNGNGNAGEANKGQTEASRRKRQKQAEASASGTGTGAGAEAGAGATESGKKKPGQAVAKKARAASRRCMLLSAGIDAQLVCCVADAFDAHPPVRAVRFPQRPPVHVAAPLLLSQQTDRLELWRLARVAEPGSEEERRKPQRRLEAGPVALATIRTGSPLPVVCSALALEGGDEAVVDPTAALVALSDAASARLFRVTLKPSAAVRKLKLAREAPPATALAFCGGGRLLALAAPSGEVAVLEAATGALWHKLVDHIPPPPILSRGGGGGGDGEEELHEPQRFPAARLLAASPDGQWLAVAGEGLAADGVEARVYVYALELGRLHRALAPPPRRGEHGGPVSALAFSTAGAELAIATAANRIRVYNVEKGSLTQWTRATENRGFSKRLLEMPGQICHLSFDPAPRARALLAATPAAACHIDLAAPPARLNDTTSNNNNNKRRRERRAPPKAAAAASGGGLRFLLLDTAALAMTYTSPAAALLVEANWQDVLGALPPPLYRHRYG